jgi:hypothetical protein
MRCVILFALLFLVAAAVPAPASAHSLGQSYIFLRVYHDSIEVRVEMTVDDLDRVLNLGWSSERGVTREEVGMHLERVLGYVRSRLYIGTGGRELPLRFARYDLHDQNIADYVLLHFMIDDMETLPQQLEVGFPVLF